LGTFFAEVAPDVVYEDLGIDLRVHGREAWQEVFQRYVDAVPDMRSRLESVTAEGNRAAGELVIEGTQAGQLVLPGGTIPASGGQFVTRTVLVIDADDQGRVTHVRHYTNPMGVLVQVGLIKPLGIS
jgi:steroid delta-isomerase-like uncharacterized protein